MCHITTMCLMTIIKKQEKLLLWLEGENEENITNNYNLQTVMLQEEM
jgi:hypothetical protein